MLTRAGAMSAAHAALAALPWGDAASGRRAREMVFRARAVELAGIASVYGGNLLREAMRSNDVGFARFLVDRMGLRGDVVMDALGSGMRDHGDVAVDVVEFLLTSGLPSVGVRARDSDGVMPLFWASWTGSLKTLRLLIRLGAPLNDVVLFSGAQFCAVSLAIDHRGDECLRELLASGADPHIAVYGPEWKGYVSLLLLATLTARPVAVALMLRAMAARGKDDSVELGKALCFAAAINKSRCIPDMLLNAGARVTSTRSATYEIRHMETTPFYRAARAGHASVARYLLRRFGSGILQNDVAWNSWTIGTSAEELERNAKFYLETLLRLGFACSVERYRGGWRIAIELDALAPAKILLKWSSISAAQRFDDFDAHDLVFATAIRRRKKCFKLLVDAGALRFESRDGFCLPFTAALLAGDKDMFQQLVRAGARVNNIASTDLNVVGDYLLLLSNESSSDSTLESGLDLFKDMMWRFRDVNRVRCARFGRRVLHQAVVGDLDAHVDFLLEQLNADVNVRDDVGCTPLMLAVLLERDDLLTRLLKVSKVDLTLRTWGAMQWTPRIRKHSFHRETPLFPKMDAFLCASYITSGDSIILLAQRGADVHVCDQRGRNAVWLASCYEFWSPEYPERTVEQLLTLGVSLDSTDSVTGLHSIHAAARAGYVSTVKLLAANGADVSAQDHDGHTVLHWTVMNRAMDRSFIAEVVRDFGADVDAQNVHGETALHIAVRRGAVGDLRYLLEAGAATHIRDVKGRSPLMMACKLTGKRDITRRWDGSRFVKDWRCALDMVHTLLQAGADVSCASTRGLQSLHYAAASGLVEVCRLLLLHGAKLNERSKSGLTPLHLSCRCGHAPMTELLVDAGAKVDLLDDHGRSPLYYAAEQGHAQCVQKLLVRGAAASLYSSALQIAKENRHASTIALLSQTGHRRVPNDDSSADLGAVCSTSSPHGELNVIGDEDSLVGLDL